jgi:hypothetical protein
VDAHRERQEQDTLAKSTNTGVLLSSGLIAGEGIMGVLIAAYAFSVQAKPAGLPFGLEGIPGEIVSFVIFLGLGYYLYRLATRKQEAE